MPGSRWEEQPFHVEGYERYKKIAFIFPWICCLDIYGDYPGENETSEILSFQSDNFSASMVCWLSCWFVHTKLMDEMCYVLCRFFWTGFDIPLPDMAAATHVLGVQVFTVIMCIFPSCLFFRPFPCLVQCIYRCNMVHMYMICNNPGIPVWICLHVFWDDLGPCNHLCRYYLNWHYSDAEAEWKICSVISFQDLQKFEWKVEASL